jgi:hypothetical protein
MSEFQISDVRCVQYEITIVINASKPHVWSGMTQRIAEWWLPDFLILGTGSDVILEPHAGGRLFERNGECELLWYTILAINPQDSMTLAGYCTAEFGGPFSTLLTVRLTATGTTTRLSISDSLFGHVTDPHAKSLRAGWSQLFDDGLRRWAESHSDAVQ